MPGKRGIGLIVVLVIAALLFYVYFVIISPIFVAKPDIQKPALGEGEPVSSEHIRWLVNELGAYKLHNSPLSNEKSEIELYVTSADKYFAVIIENNVPQATEGRSENPDIRISGSRDVIAALLASEDMIADAKKLSDEGKIRMEILKEMAELVPKGYKALYDEIA